MMRSGIYEVLVNCEVESKCYKIVNKKVQGVPQSQTAANTDI